MVGSSFSLCSYLITEQLCEEGIVALILHMRKGAQCVVTRGHKIEASAWYCGRFNPSFVIVLLLKLCPFGNVGSGKNAKSEGALNMLSDINKVFM